MPAAAGVAIEVPQMVLVAVGLPTHSAVIWQPGASRSTSSPAPCTGVVLEKQVTLSGSPLSVQAAKFRVKTASPTEPTPIAPVTQPGAPTPLMSASLPVETNTAMPSEFSVENAKA